MSVTQGLLCEGLIKEMRLILQCPQSCLIVPPSSPDAADISVRLLRMQIPATVNRSAHLGRGTLAVRPIAAAAPPPPPLFPHLRLHLQIAPV